MTEREALKLALEAFEAIPEEIEGWIPDKCTDAVIAIKEVLAQPPLTENGIYQLGYHNGYGFGEAYAKEQMAQRKPLTDEECDRIYTALDQWAREFDQYEFGLPVYCGDGMIGGRAIIRAAHGIKE